MSYYKSVPILFSIREIKKNKNQGLIKEGPNHLNQKTEFASLSPLFPIGPIEAHENDGLQGLSVVCLGSSKTLESDWAASKHQC